MCVQAHTHTVCESVKIVASVYQLRNSATLDTLLQSTDACPRRLVTSPKTADTVPSRGGGSRYKLPGGRGSVRGPGARLSCTRFYLSQRYQYMSTVQINPFRPSPSHSAIEIQPFRFSVKNFSRSALIGGTEKYFFHRSPTPLSAALHITHNTVLSVA
jgi:hypothetical protein